MTLQELKVMIVDDNPLAMNLASAVLRRIGVQQIVEAAKQLGISGFIPKPYTPQKIEEMRSAPI